jgi:hypothetical protein
MKNSPKGIEPATFPLLAQCLNQMCDRVYGIICSCKVKYTCPVKATKAHNWSRIMATLILNFEISLGEWLGLRLGCLIP